MRSISEIAYRFFRMIPEHTLIVSVRPPPEGIDMRGVTAMSRSARQNPLRKDSRAWRDITMAAREPGTPVGLAFNARKVA
jgi:hypothetical protein